mmetsp:Transcript_38006/g.108586  ORF Transcript_38006/g.108586 Transcript_38006/m.108586 type:complete len:215 (+) Transcript_38006:573-1217(+)
MRLRKVDFGALAARRAGPRRKSPEGTPRVAFPALLAPSVKRTLRPPASRAARDFAVLRAALHVRRWRSWQPQMRWREQALLTPWSPCGSTPRRSRRRGSWPRGRPRGPWPWRAASSSSTRSRPSRRPGRRRAPPPSFGSSSSPTARRSSSSSSRAPPDPATSRSASARSPRSRRPSRSAPAWPLPRPWRLLGCAVSTCSSRARIGARARAAPRA